MLQPHRPLGNADLIALALDKLLDCRRHVASRLHLLELLLRVSDQQFRRLLTVALLRQLVLLREIEAVAQHNIQRRLVVEHCVHVHTLLQKVFHERHRRLAHGLEREVEQRLDLAPTCSRCTVAIQSLIALALRIEGVEEIPLQPRSQRRAQSSYAPSCSSRWLLRCGAASAANCSAPNIGRLRRGRSP